MPVATTRVARIAPALGTWSHSYCFLGTPLLDPSHAVPGARALLSHTLECARLVVLESFAGGGPAGGAIDEAVAELDLATIESTRHERALLGRRSSDTYLETMRGHRRRELNRLGRRLEGDRGTLEVADQAGDPEAIERFLELERSGWKGRSQTALGSVPGHAAFLRAVGGHFEADDRLQLLALSAGGETVAMKCSLYSGEGGFCFKIAHDEALGRFSPGVQLERENIRVFHHKRSELWQDSCADPQNDMINRLWPDRRAIRTLVLARPGVRARAWRAVIKTAREIRKVGNTRPWTPALLSIEGRHFARAFGSATLPVGHSLTHHPLLEVEAIASLAERLDENSVEHNLANLPKVVDPEAVARRSEPVGDIARNIETNYSWMVLKNIEADPNYKRLLYQCLDEVSPYVDERDGGMTEREGFIFLSAPGSMTPSHTDPEHNFLLQVRGTKQMNVGRFPDPQTEQLALEQALGGGHRNVHWEPADPVAYDLEPGDGVYVPPHAPHWVQNGEAVSVSLSITFATPASHQRRRVHSINGRLRRLGLSPSPPGRRPRLDRGKVATFDAMGRVRFLRR